VRVAFRCFPFIITTYAGHLLTKDANMSANSVKVH